MHNMSNPNQGEYKRVLCVCSAGLLRSPTAALVLASEPFNFNTRAAGLAPDYALVVVDEYLLAWADEVVCMTGDQKAQLLKMIHRNKLGASTTPHVVCLDIEDDYSYRDPTLIQLITSNYKAKFEKSAK